MGGNLNLTLLNVDVDSQDGFYSFFYRFKLVALLPLWKDPSQLHMNLWQTFLGCYYARSILMEFFFRFKTRVLNFRFIFGFLATCLLITFHVGLFFISFVICLWFVYFSLQPFWCIQSSFKLGNEYSRRFFQGFKLEGVMQNTLKFKKIYIYGSPGMRVGYARRVGVVISL